MTEELLPETHETPPPTTLAIETLRSRKHGGSFGPLLPRVTAPKHENDDENEGASKGHEEDLPPG